MNAFDALSLAVAALLQRSTDAARLGREGFNERKLCTIRQDAFLEAVRTVKEIRSQLLAGSRGLSDGSEDICASPQGPASLFLPNQNLGVLPKSVGSKT